MILNIGTRINIYSYRGTQPLVSSLAFDKCVGCVQITYKNQGKNYQINGRINSYVAENVTIN